MSSLCFPVNTATVFFIYVLAYSILQHCVFCFRFCDYIELSVLIYRFIVLFLGNNQIRSNYR